MNDKSFYEKHAFYGIQVVLETKSFETEKVELIECLGKKLWKTNFNLFLWYLNEGKFSELAQEISKTFFYYCSNLIDKESSNIKRAIKHSRFKKT